MHIHIHISLRMYIHTRVYIIIIKTKYNWDFIYEYKKLRYMRAYARAHRVFLYHISCKLFFSYTSSRWYLSSLYFVYSAYFFFSLRSASISFVALIPQPLASLLMRHNYDFSHASIWRGYTIFFRDIFFLSHILFYEHALRCANVHCMS